MDDDAAVGEEEPLPSAEEFEEVDGLPDLAACLL